MRQHDPHTHYSYYRCQAGRGYNSFTSTNHHQFGGNGGAQPSFNVFRGVPSQRGYGILSNVIRRFGVPLITYLAPRLFAKGKEIASDIYLRDRPPKEAIRARLKEGGRELLRDTLNKAANYTNNHFGQEGSGQPLKFQRYNLRPRGVKRKLKSTSKRGARKKRKTVKKPTKRRTRIGKSKNSKKKKKPSKRRKSSTRSSKVNIFV